MMLPDLHIILLRRYNLQMLSSKNHHQKISYLGWVVSKSPFHIVLLHLTPCPAEKE